MPLLDPFDNLQGPPIMPDSMQIKRALNANRYHATYKAIYDELVAKGVQFVDFNSSGLSSIPSLHENGVTDIVIDYTNDDPPQPIYYNLWDDMEGVEGHWFPTATAEDSWLTVYASRFMPAYNVVGWNLVDYRFSVGFAILDKEQRFYIGVFVRSQVRFCQILAAECLAKIVGLTSHRL